MLFRLVRPMKRAGSRNQYFVERIPRDVKPKAVGLKLAVPVGERTQPIRITSRTEAVRVSLRTDHPAEVKIRQAAIAAFFERTWEALRQEAPVQLTPRQQTALAGELYRAWATEHGDGRSIAIEHDPDFRLPDHVERVRDGKREVTPWARVPQPHIGTAEWEAVLQHWKHLVAQGLDENEPETQENLQRLLGPIVDRLLLARGIKHVDEPTRTGLLLAFWQALRDAFAVRVRTAAGDYSPDPNASRFPEWQRSEASSAPHASLSGLLQAWWKEAKAAGRKPSTYQSYSGTMAAFSSFIGHDDAARVTRDDVVRFKDYRLVCTNLRTGRPISPKTIKDSDLAALKTVFGWAVTNGKLSRNPAEGVTLKLPKRRKLRSKSFTDEEAAAILRTTLSLKRGKENAKTFAAKRWVSWLCAYTGGRVGELAQIRKEDLRKVGMHWVLTITPEAGTVKTNEAREVVLHAHLVEQGFVDFVKAASPGHLFLSPGPKGTVLGRLKALKNRLREFVRAVVHDKNVAPTHAWRHRFKTIGLENGIPPRILDAIQGQQPRTVSEEYGEVTIKAQAAAIRKVPRYRV